MTLDAVAARSRVLRSLAAEIGHASRHAQRSLGDGDAARFLSPLRDVLADIGGTLAAYRDSTAQRLLAARFEVRAALPLLEALAAPATPPSAATSPLEYTPVKKVRFARDVDTREFEVGTPLGAAFHSATIRCRSRCARRTAMMRRMHREGKKPSVDSCCQTVEPNPTTTVDDHSGKKGTAILVGECLAPTSPPAVCDVAVGPDLPTLTELSDCHRGWISASLYHVDLERTRYVDLLARFCTAFGPISDEVRRNIQEYAASLIEARCAHHSESPLQQASDSEEDSDACFYDDWPS